MELVLLCFVLHLIAQSEALCNVDDLKGTASCFNNVETQCIFTKQNTNLSYNAIEGSEQTSSYSLKFTAFENKCDFTHYKVTLDYLMRVTNEFACLHNTTDINEPGTNLIILPEIEVSPVCHKLELSFCYDYWFSGCYRFKFLPLTGKNTHKPVDHYVWMKNSHTIADYVIKKPNFIDQENEPFIIKWKFFNTFPEGFTSVHHYLKNAHTSEVINEDDCHLNATSMTCFYGNLPEGDYKADLLIDLPRCKLNGSTCRWEMPFRREARSSTTEIPVLSKPESNTKWIILSSVVLLIILIVFAIKWYLDRRRGPQSLIIPPHDSEAGIQMEQCDKIFLLYARDCSLFMDTMSEFRKYLGERAKCPVFDIYDNSQFNTMALSPHEYVESVLRDRRSNVVILATPCIDLMQTCSLNNMTMGGHEGAEISYRSPKSPDSHMIQALKSIPIDITETTYRKFFVVRVRALDSQNDHLVRINPGTRFDFPQGLDSLLSSMLVPPPQTEEETQASMLQKRRIDEVELKLREYVQNNPKYLRDILKDHLFNQSNNF